MSSLIDNWRKFDRLIAWPRSCALCAAPLSGDSGVCAACHDDLAWLDRSCCYCALPLAPASRATSCPDCQRRPAFDAAFAACHYDEAMAWLVGALKFQGRIMHARTLAILLAHRLQAAGWSGCDLLVPVPLHAKSFRGRGFNQAERIAHHLGRLIDVPVDGDALYRSRVTHRQSTLTVTERTANVRGAFGSRRDLSGARIAIVDDVITTTKTARAAADAARRAGAIHITALAPARA